MAQGMVEQQGTKHSSDNWMDGATLTKVATHLGRCGRDKCQHFQHIVFRNLFNTEAYLVTSNTLWTNTSNQEIMLGWDIK